MSNYSRRKGQNPNRGRGRKSRARRTNVEKFAYNLELVQKGLKNPDSRVTESYQNGMKAQEAKKRKPLF